MAHTDIGFAIMTRAVGELAGMGHPDAEPKLIGRNIHVMLTPLPVNKRKPKWHVEGSELKAVEDGPDKGNDDDDDGDDTPPPSAKGN
jgi:translation initiation factor IF-3